MYHRTSLVATHSYHMLLLSGWQAQHVPAWRSACYALGRLERSRRSRARSALGQEVFQPGFEVGSHQHSLHSVHRPPILEQHQRGQRCIMGGMGERRIRDSRGVAMRAEPCLP